MLTEPEKAVQRESLLRVIASILHFSAPEAAQVAATIAAAAASADDPVGSALASSWAGWAGVGSALLGAYAAAPAAAAPATASGAAAASSPLRTT